MSSTADILTPRLRLAAITPDLLRLENSGLARHLDVEVPDLWPPEHWEPHVYDFIERQCLDTPHAIGWNRYVVLRSPLPVLVGTLGGFPRTSTETEVGYSILSPWQGQGVATEGLRAMINEIFRTTEVTSISAQTFPHLVGSVRVLEKCGFQQVGSGDDEGTIRYRLARARN